MPATILVIDCTADLDARLLFYHHQRWLDYLRAILATWVLFRSLCVIESDSFSLYVCNIAKDACYELEETEFLRAWKNANDIGN